MNKRTEMINMFYDGYTEDTRLIESRHGQLEYLTTMHYIHQAASQPAKIIEIGAGTGRYSIALAKEGHDVTSGPLYHFREQPRYSAAPFLTVSYLYFILYILSKYVIEYGFTNHLRINIHYSSY